MKYLAPKKEAYIIDMIVDRARKLGIRAHVIDLEYDITVTHLNGCRLDLDRFIKADDENFLHDVAGIQKHLNRATGKLENLFLPRFAAIELETN